MRREHSSKVRTCPPHNLPSEREHSQKSNLPPSPSQQRLLLPLSARLPIPATPNPTNEMASTAESDASTPAPASAPSAPYRVPTIGEAAEGEAGAGDEFAGVDEIKGSMCMACGGDGTTRMLTTKIPFFREVILSSFECDDCHWRNNEVRTLCDTAAAIVIIFDAVVRAVSLDPYDVRARLLFRSQRCCEL